MPTKPEILTPFTEKVWPLPPWKVRDKEIATHWTGKEEFEMGRIRQRKEIREGTLR